MNRWFVPVLAVTLAACTPSPLDAVAVETAPAPAFSAVAALPGALAQVARLRGADNGARREAILALLVDFGLEATLQEVPHDGSRGDARTVGHNIVVDIGSGERDLIIGAHYDKIGVGEGMVDNGASVVVLLHAMQALKGQALPYRLRFVFFDLEEVGLVGARHFAASVDAARTQAMINLDVNAYGDTVFYGRTMHGHSGLYRALERGCSDHALRCVEFPNYPPSDNLAFERAGIPNVSLSVLPATEVHQLWLLMNAGEHSGLAEGFMPGVFLTIHTQGDTLVRVEADAMALSYNALMGLVHEFSRQ